MASFSRIEKTITTITGGVMREHLHIKTNTIKQNTEGSQIKAVRNIIKTVQISVVPSDKTGKVCIMDKSSVSEKTNKYHRKWSI